MSRKVSFKLSGPHLESALKFSNDLNMPLDYVAMKALFLVMKQAYSPEPTLDLPSPALHNGFVHSPPSTGAIDGNPPARDPERDSDPVPGSAAGSGDALADPPSVVCDELVP